MALSITAKEKVNTMIYKRAYEIEQALSEDDFFLARMCGINPTLNPYKIEEVALKCAIKELQNIIKD